MSAAHLLEIWLSSRLTTEVMAWLHDRRGAVQRGDRKQLFLTFGLVARKTGKADLNLSAADLSQAEAIRKGWNPACWTMDQAARVWLLLSFPDHDAADLVYVADQLFAAGEVHELVALYQGLPLYAHQESWRLRCAEGIRSNIRAVLTAIAHRNPYPSEQLDEGAWNQLVLKCMFVGLTLNPIVGLDSRANADLARIVIDYAEERRSAHRPVSPELWRLVAPLADERALNLMKDVLSTGNDCDRQGVAMALSVSAAAGAKEILAGVPELARRIQSGEVTWATIAALPWNET